MNINILQKREEAIIPTRAHEDDAGYDLYATDSPDKSNENKVTIPPHQYARFKTGIAMEIPTGYVGLVFARSGLGIKKGLVPRNCVGVIDSNYRGEIEVSLYNSSRVNQTIDIGDRIAQIVIVPYLKYDINVVEELSETDRGEDGFGSSGKN